MMIQDYPDCYVRINRDDLRSMIDVGAFSKGREELIRKAELTLAKLYFESGKTPIIDDCNLSEHAQNMWKNFSQEMKAKLTVVDFTHVSLEECIERDKKRQNYVGEAVIRRMYKQWITPAPVVYQRDPSKAKAVIFDMDGTLAFLNGRSPYDASTCENDLVNEPVAQLARFYALQEYAILIVSGRENKYREQTEGWLATNDIPYNYLFMRKTGDNRKDSIVKKEIFENDINPFYNIEVVVDDRKAVVSMWRNELGLTVFQVAEGDY